MESPTHPFIPGCDKAPHQSGWLLGHSCVLNGEPCCSCRPQKLTSFSPSQVYRTPGFSFPPYRFSVTASPVLGCSSEPASDLGPFPVTFDSNLGVSSARFPIQTAGQYTLRGALNGVPFRSSSALVVSVSAGDVLPKKAVVSGLGSPLVAGVTSAVRVDLTDVWGNRDIPPGANCSVVIHTASGVVSALDCVRSVGCGLPFCQRILSGCYFTANVTASQAGPVSVDVLINSVSVLGSGMATSVVPGPPAAKFSAGFISAKNSTIVRAGSNVDVSVTLRDAFNNSVTSVLGRADVILETSLDMGGCTAVERFDAVDSGSLSESVLAYSHQPSKPGNLTLRVLVGGLEVPGSKTVVSIVPGPTSAAKSGAAREGIHTAVAGVLTSFTVQLRDRFGNPQTQPGDGVNASFLSVPGSPPPVCSPVESLGVGAYRVSYIAYAPQVNGGARILNVTVTSANGTAEPILGSPFVVTVRRGPAVANLSTVTQTTPSQTAQGPPVIPTGQPFDLNVTLKDAQGNAGPGQKVPNEPALSFVSFPEPVNQTGGLTPASTTTVIDFGTGTVLARFTPNRAGLYNLVVQLGGVDLPGGRLVVNVTQGDVAYDQTVVYAAANGGPLIASNSPEVNFFLLFRSYLSLVSGIGMSLKS